MTPDQRAVIRSWVGSTPDDADLAARLHRLSTASAVALEILRGRRAEMLTQPLNRTLVGDLTLDATANIAALDQDIARLMAFVAAEASGVADGEVTFGGLVRPDRERGAPQPCRPFPFGI